jgi:hypothetical protein
MKKGLKTFLQILPVIVSTLLIAAHFLRTGSYLLVLVSLLFPLILLKRHPLSARVMQGFLVLATIEWVRTILNLVSFRSSIGLPWTRMVIILGTVACFTLASALVFYSKTHRERYRLIKRQ